MIEFFAPGIARPKGSKRMVRTSGGRTLLIEDSKREKPWRQVVTLLGMEAMAGRPLLEGPLCVRLTFHFPRPKSHFLKRGLRADAPVFHTSKPDSSKLARSVEDALNGIVWKDDSAIAILVVGKAYSVDAPGVRIQVEPAGPRTMFELVAGSPQGELRATP